nr:unnamed protein product [Callosobruchus analis]
MQQIWISKVDWDEQLPKPLVESWNQFAKNMSQISHISIKRWLFIDKTVRYIQLHGFADASMQAYGACIYIRVTYTNGTSTSNLLCSKSRIAPIKAITLPGLELSAALLLARLVTKVISVYTLEISKVVLWSDSQIVLAWIKSHPSRWNMYVSNRVSEIQTLTCNYEWHHVRSSLNPADIISRGATPVDLINSKLWWYGPTELYDEPGGTVDKNDSVISEYGLPEERKVTHTTAVINYFPWSRFSCYNKLKWTFAYCLRFINSLRTPNQRQIGNLSVEELKESEKTIFKLIQAQSFSNAVRQLKSNGVIENKQLISLNPFVDKNELLRVSGRLAKADLQFDTKFPVILPNKSYVVRLIIKDEHNKLFHAGPQAVLASLRLRFWIINGIREVKAVLKDCVLCHKFKADAAQQLMGTLPYDRVTMARPFLKAGVDFAGPITIKDTRLRKSIRYKAYVSVFVCMVTKAIH